MSKLAKLLEGAEKGDLFRVVHPKLHIDEFKSKMGSDSNIIVLSFKLTSKEPANDLMNFIERGYPWVLDSDVSSGELDDGEYLVFVELERDPEAAEQIVKLMKDLLNLTNQKLSDWRVQYQKSREEYEISEESIRAHVPLTPESYDAKYKSEKDEIEDEVPEISPEDEDAKFNKELEAMKESARIITRKQAPVNDWTNSIRVAAGLK